MALRDGKVLVIGAGNFPASLYDPATNDWTVSTSGAVRGWPTITTLQDGRVLVAGGIAGVPSGTPPPRSTTPAPTSGALARDHGGGAEQRHGRIAQ